MPIDLFRPRAGDLTPPPIRPAADAAFAVLPRLRALRETLAVAACFRDACRRIEARRALPPQFYFSRTRQKELDAACGPTPRFPEPYVPEARRRRPREAAAWQDVFACVEKLRLLFLGDVNVRQAARAVPGLSQAVAALANEHPAARELMEWLAVLDEEVVLVVEPASRLGVRVEVQGIASINQFHTMLTELVPNLHHGSTSRVQLFALSGLQSDGSLPAGLNGSGHWLWGENRASSIPVFEGERVVLLGESPFPVPLSGEARIPELRAEARICRALSRQDVLAYLSRWTGQPISDVPLPAIPVRAA